MNDLAKKLEAIRRRQQPVSSEVFWAQVEAFKDKPQEVTPAFLTSSEGLMPGRQREDNCLVVNG
ncbi:MAG: hypothetical protein HS117_20545 [Verrucomicrobiaceae bacterium]|jgi:hypothetical protein|nr:hypothetical protein [Verrucomicrobiaceae bacterium]